MSDDVADAVIDIYDRTAAAWDVARRESRPVGEAGWVRGFMDLAGPGAEVLDLGCGAGEPVAAQLIAGGLRVTGVDSSPAMIEICRRRFPDHEWVVSDIRRLEIGRAFDGLLAWHSLFHLTPEDQGAMFAVFAKSVRLGAPLMFTSGHRQGVSIGRWQGSPLYHASLAPEEYRALLTSNGFSEINHASEDAATGGASIWLARREAP